MTNVQGGITRRVGLVMAGSKGLGRGSAVALAASGHDLVVCARNAEELQATGAELRQYGGMVETVQADVSQRTDSERIFQRTDEAFGRLDVLVANAGGPPPGAFLAVTEEQWYIAFQLTLMSAVRAMRLAVDRMQRNRFGRIVVIGSSSVKDPIPNLSLSNAFRPALYGCVKTLAREVAADGITVNMVSPGRIDTDRVRSLDESRAETLGVSISEVRDRSAQSIPAGRYGQPADLGAMVNFLASENAGYITGQSILVDGGMVSAL
jgi:3-oxoacyl-[acyl-carrier protein] reductase